MTKSSLYEIFLKVAKLKNITKASQELFISQPAISQNIKQLEQQIGGKLFERQNKGVELTTLGMLLLSQVEPLINKLNNLENLGKLQNCLEKGFLRIGSNSSNCNQIISNQLTLFSKKYKNIKIEMIRENQNNLLKMLENNELDIIYMDKCTIPNNLTVVKEYDVEYQLIGNKEYFEKYKNGTLKIQDEIILPNAKNKSREFINKFFEQKNMALNSKYELDNYILLYDFVKNGLGIAFVNLEYYKQNIESGEVFILSPSYKIKARKFFVLENKSFKNPAKDAFLQISIE